MSPGYLEQLIQPRCPECGGWDMGSIGSIHHKAMCSRNPYCQFCPNPIEPGDRRVIVLGAAAHEGCAVDFEHDRTKDGGYA